MSRHTHRPIESTTHAASYGIAQPRCAKMDRGKACGNSDSHLMSTCRCGAEGVYCHDVGRWHWRGKEDR